MGVSNIITFDAHDPRVQNSIPLNGFDNFTPPYQFISALLRTEDDLLVDKEHLMVISPDEGALDRAVYFANVLGVDTGPVTVVEPAQATRRRLDEALAGLDAASVPLGLTTDAGRHNLALAVTAAEAWGVPVATETIRRVVTGFDALPHRLAWVARAAGRDWYDDTLSTSAESVIAAADALAGASRVLILGGQSRGIAYDKLNDYLLSQSDDPPWIVTMPTNGPEISAAYEARHPDRVRHTGSLAEAVRTAAATGPGGGAVILSPGAPSYDLYPNYEAKSADFAAQIARLDQTR